MSPKPRQDGKGSAATDARSLLDTRLPARPAEKAKKTHDTPGQLSLYWMIMTQRVQHILEAVRQLTPEEHEELLACLDAEAGIDPDLLKEGYALAAERIKAVDEGRVQMLDETEFRRRLNVRLGRS